MKASALFTSFILLSGVYSSVRAHDLGETSHDHAAQPDVYHRQQPTSRVWRREQLLGDTVLLAQADLSGAKPNAIPVLGNGGRGQLPAITTSFRSFAPKVKTTSDREFLYVESDGMPAHTMMVGITAWQQQVPLPQPYHGLNVWRIPLHPVATKNPMSIKGRFLRGAIALAANGIPIFNPQNNRGEVSQEVGELDQWGGHCGRADDYHYHAAPLHLQEMVGKGQPIAYALDGYPLYGLMEPDGSAPERLDSFNGHETPTLGYHYHGSTQYPYVNGGFHGEVVEVGGQVDPQPRAQPLREAGAPLRGARITGFTAKDKSYSLKYEVGGETRFVNYALNDNGTVKFDYVDGRGQVRSETVTPRAGGGDRPPGEPKGKSGPKKGPGPDGPPPRGDRPPGDRGEVPSAREAAARAEANFTPKRTGTMQLRSSAVVEGGALPVEFTGDGDSYTPPLEWTGAPSDTKSFAVIMHHIPGPGEVKWYWTLYNISADVHRLPKQVQGVGTLGNNSVNGRLGYAAPHSKGPGAKTYILTVYAISAPVQLTEPNHEVSRAVLLAAMKNSILDSAELKVTYDRTGMVGAERKP